MIRRLPLHLLWMSILLQGAAIAAQNNEITLLLGLVPANTQVFPSSYPVKVNLSGGVSLQLAYSYQALRLPGGELWVELPVTWAFRGNVSSGLGAAVSGYDSTYFTPGARFKVHLNSHVALYALAGGGIGSFGYSEIFSGRSAGISVGRTTHGVADFGGGLDFRITRLLSLRAEARDFVSAAGLGGTAGHNHMVYGFGLGFHF